MSIYFLDTSALAKRYVAETGSNWIRGWIPRRAGHEIIISRLATVELIAVAVRKLRDKTLPQSDFRRLRNNFYAHVRDQYQVIEFEPGVLSLSRQLLLKYPIRTLDSIQLASALRVGANVRQALTFVAADARLLAAAAAEGLPTDDPNLHP